LSKSLSKKTDPVPARGTREFQEISVEQQPAEVTGEVPAVQGELEWNLK